MVVVAVCSGREGGRGGGELSLVGGGWKREFELFCFFFLCHLTGFGRSQVMPHFCDKS